MPGTPHGLPDDLDPDQKVKMAGALPKGPSANGLIHIAPELISDAADGRFGVRAAIVLYTVGRVELAPGSKTPVINVTRIEPLQQDYHLMTAEGILQEAYEDRTGQGVLPFELTTDVDRAFEAARTPNAAAEKQERDRENMTAADELREHLHVVHVRSDARTLTDARAAEVHGYEHADGTAVENGMAPHTADWLGWTSTDLEAAEADTDGGEVADDDLLVPGDAR
jgi:hypothetical protein